MKGVAKRSLSPGVAVAAHGSGAKGLWRRKGRALASARRRPSGGGGVGNSTSAAGDRKDFFNAEALSVCISSVVEEQR